MAIETSSLFNIIELYGHNKIKSGYRSSNLNSPNGSPWKYLKSYTGAMALLYSLVCFCLIILFSVLKMFRTLYMLFVVPMNTLNFVYVVFCQYSCYYRPTVHYVPARYIGSYQSNNLTLWLDGDTKWPIFCRRHFQTHFLEWKLLQCCI